MSFKKSFSLIMVIIFIGTTILAQFAWAQNVSQATLLEDLAKIENALYGQSEEKPLIERVEYLEKELVGRTLPGTISNRVKQLKEFIILGTSNDPSVVFKINASEWILEDNITQEPLANRIENLEIILFGEISNDVLAMRAESIFEVCFKEGTPQVEEVMIPSGTLIPVLFLAELSSKKNETGDMFNVQITENVFLEDKLIIPENALATGKITKAKNASLLLQKGKLEIEFESVPALDGSLINLVLGEEAEEENKRLAVAVGVGILGLVVLSNPIGLIAGALVPGKNVTIEEGTEMFLQVERDTPVIALVQ